MLQRLGRVILLVMLTAFSASWAIIRVNATRDSYQEDTPRQAQPVLDESAASKEMLEQSKVFETWSLTILTGILAILITAKIHRVAHPEWLYLVIGPAAALLIGTLYASWVFRKRYTFLILQRRLHEYETLMRLLQDQTVIFKAALAVMVIFGAVFLFGVVYGTVHPFDATKE
jgi:hypothetical protein